MATSKTFEEIDAWKEARTFTSEIYRVSNEASFTRDFSLRDQMRRAAISIMSNIAEGFERDGTAEFVQFLSVAKSSCGELCSQLYVALDAGHVNETAFADLKERSERISRMLHGSPTCGKRTFEAASTGNLKPET